MKRIDLSISLLLASIAYLCSYIFILVLQFDETPFEPTIAGGLPAFLGLMLFYISTPVIFVVGNLFVFVGIDPYVWYYPHSYPIIGAHVVFLLSLGVAFLIRRFRRS